MWKEIISLSEKINDNLDIDYLWALDQKIAFQLDTILYLDSDKISLDSLKQKILFVFNNFSSEIDNLHENLWNKNNISLKYIYWNVFKIILNYISSIYSFYSKEEKKEIIIFLKKIFFSEKFNDLYEYIICMSDISLFLNDLIINNSLEPEVNEASQEYFINSYTRNSLNPRDYIDFVYNTGTQFSFFNIYSLFNPENYKYFTTEDRNNFYLENWESTDFLVDFLLKYDFSDIDNIFVFKKEISNYDSILQWKLLKKFKENKILR